MSRWFLTDLPHKRLGATVCFLGSYEQCILVMYRIASIEKIIYTFSLTWYRQSLQKMYRRLN